MSDAQRPTPSVSPGSTKTHSRTLAIAVIIGRTMKIQIAELGNSGDGRGFSFTAPAEALAFVGL
jgi:hypothetical protein